MLIVALCPTYRRRRLLENSLACFGAQTHEHRRLLICDDSGEHVDQEGDRWRLLAYRSRFRTLPDKYNALAHWATVLWPAVEVFCVWEDDDVYLPHHLAAHATALKAAPGGWSHPSVVFTDGSGGPNPGKLQPEPTGHGRLHGALAISRALWEQQPWPATRQMDFDLQYLARLRERCPPADPCRQGPPSYYFRWASTGASHGQSFSTGPADEHWLQKAQAAIDGRLGPVQPLGPLVPQMDAETAGIFAFENSGERFSGEWVL